MANNSGQKQIGEGSLSKIFNLVKELVSGKADKATILSGTLLAGQELLLIQGSVIDISKDLNVEILTDNSEMRMKSKPVVSNGNIQLYFKPVDTNTRVRVIVS